MNKKEKLEVYSLAELYDYKMKKVGEIEQQQMEEHIKKCERCKKELEELEKITELLSEWEVPEYPPELDEKILSQIRFEKKISFKEKISTFFRPFYIKIPVGVLATSLLVFFALFFSKMLFVPEEKEIPREIKFSFKVTEVKNPIIVEVENVDKAFSEIVKKIESSNGKLIKRRKTELGLELTFSIRTDCELELLRSISLLGKVKIKKEEFRDSEGNIVLIIKKVDELRR